MIVRGDHSSEILIITKSIIVKGENGAIVKGIDIRAPSVITGFSVTGREAGIYANGVSGSSQYPFVIEGCHCYLNGYGIRLYYCNNVIIKNNLLESNSEIEFHVEHMDNGKIVGNNLGEATYQPGGGDYGQCEDMTVTGNDIRGGTDASWAQACVNCVFNDNILKSKYGFKYNSYGQNGSGSGNQIESVVPACG